MNKPAIYIHIPFCKRKCNYCAFVSVCDKTKQKEYISALIKEIESKANKSEISTVYIGGGTPSTLYKGAITQILDAVKKCFSLTANCEITVEGNPDSITEEFVKECKDNGVNRISLGIQSTHKHTLEFLGRIHDEFAYKKAIEIIRANGIDNISGDLIIGVPNQTKQEIEQDIIALVHSDLSHISVYSLSIEEGTPFYKNGVTVDEDSQADMYELVCSLLKKHGYDRYEVSNFAKDGKISKHNSKYWKGVVYYGFGVAAHSLLPGDERSENTSSINEYLQGITTISSHPLSKQEKMEERIMLLLRTSDGLDISAFNKDFSTDLVANKKEQINKLKDNGLIKIENETIKVTDKGFYLLDSIIMELI